MSSRYTHIIGAGLAGLSAALQLTLAGEKVVMYEAAPFAGGRCRSFMDRELGCLIDNGNHLVLSGNAGIQDYLFLTGALDTMGGPGTPTFPFMDLANGERWVVHMNQGRFPWWIFDKGSRIPGTKPLDYLSGLKILTAGPTDTVAGRLDTRTALYRRFWEPLVIGALNTEPDAASAQLLANIFKQSFGAGGKACVPLIPQIGLSETFIHPCMALLQKKGVITRFSHRLGAIKMAANAVRELHFNQGVLEIQPQDWVILALPAWVTRDLLPTVTTPGVFRSILNAHYRVEVPRNPAGFTGIIGGVAEWVFVRSGVVSVTVSCAERYEAYPVREMAGYIWQELAKLYDLDAAKVPPHRIFREKYATFAATPEQNRRRPTSHTNWKNLALAGEWTATGLPSTIEGAIRSGLRASQVVMRSDA
ncbi:MAG: hydroxysqualene dehydroxylase HpnE [Pseudomonadota bacterium]|nr:hydroxysqualene dehydroxylase HpnE [Pseudomonadota bacterium]